MALKPNPPCQLSLWKETGVPGENPRLSAERWLHSFHMRTGFESTLRWTLLNRIEPGTLEVKGEWSDHYTTETPKSPPENANNEFRQFLTILDSNEPKHEPMNKSRNI